MRGFAGDVRAAADRFLQDQGFLLASALSFAFLSCLAPLALILFSVAGFLLESEEIAEHILQNTTLLVPAYGDEIMEFLILLMRERAVTGIVGAIGMAIFVSRLFALIRTIVNRAFRVAIRRGPVRGFLFDLSAVVVLGSLVVAYTVALVVLAAVGHFAVQVASVPLPELPLKWIVSVVLVYLVGGVLLYFVYRAFPNIRVPPRAAVTATVTVVVLWVVARRAFGAYVASFGVYGKLYGSFGIGVAVLVWIYYSATIFIFGAELAAVVAERISRARSQPPVPAASTDGVGTITAMARRPSDERLAQFKEVASEMPDDPVARFGLAGAFLDAGLAEDAVREYEQTLRLQADYSAAWRGLGRALERAGRAEEARAAYVRGIEVATRKGDLQTKKEMEVFLRRLER